HHDSEQSPKATMASQRSSARTQNLRRRGIGPHRITIAVRAPAIARRRRRIDRRSGGPDSRTEIPTSACSPKWGPPMKHGRIDDYLTGRMGSDGWTPGDTIGGVFDDQPEEPPPHEHEKNGRAHHADPPTGPRALVRTASSINESKVIWLWEH